MRQPSCRALVLVLLAASAVGCMGPKLQLVPNAPNIQAQCGCKQGVELTGEQALCIAKLAGLEKGIDRWGLRSEGDYWQVYNFLQNKVGENQKGRYMRIKKKDGQIIEVGEWSEIIVL